MYHTCFVFKLGHYLEHEKKSFREKKEKGYITQLTSEKKLEQLSGQNSVREQHVNTGLC